MDISTLMNENCLSFDVELQSKEDVFQYLSEQLFQEQYISSKEEFLTALYYRESLSETGLGDGIAIPHGKTDCVEKAGIAFVRLRNAIPWESLDGKPISYVFMLAIPHQGGDDAHIRMISELARSLIRPKVIQKLSVTNSAKELLACFAEEV